MEKTEVKFGDWLQAGFDLYKDNFAILTIASLLVLLLSGVSGGILAGPMMAGMFIVTLALIDGKEPKPSGTDVFKAFEIFLQPFLLSLVWGAILCGAYLILMVISAIPLLGCIVLPVGALAIAGFSVMLGFAMPLVADQRMDFWPASMKSIEIVKNNYWAFLGYFLVAGLIGGIGTAACYVGVIFTFPIQIAMLAVAYRAVCGGGDAEALPPTPEGPAPEPAEPAPEAEPEETPEAEEPKAESAE